MKTVIAGWPKSGKTQLSRKLAGEQSADLTSTDTLKESHGWSEASEAVAGWFDRPGPWIIEGVAAVRALRKWLKRNEEGKPCDVIYYLSEPFVELTKGQSAMGTGVDTVMAEIRDELESRGVQLVWGFPESESTAVASSVTEMRSPKLDA